METPKPKPAEPESTAEVKAETEAELPLPVIVFDPNEADGQIFTCACGRGYRMMAKAVEGNHN